MFQNYGITWEEYAQMLIAQEGKCAICGTTKPGGAGRFHVDHCHNSKDVRGLLCTCCNTGIGMFKDNHDVIIKAANYLLNYPTKRMEGQ